MLSLKLLLSNFAAHRVRLALTVAAIALSVSLVVSVTTGYTSAQGAAEKFMAQYMGSTDVTVTPGQYHGTMGEGLAALLAADPAVASAAGRFETQRGLLDEHGLNIVGKMADVVGVSLPGDKELTAQRLEAGAWFDGDGRNVAVVDQVVARACNVKVGGTITIPGLPKPMTATVVGIVHKPQILAEGRQTIYLPLRTLQAFENEPGKVSRVLVILRKGADDAAFVARWQARLADDPAVRAAAGGGAKLRSARDSRQQMEKNLEGVHLMTYLGGAVALVAATFIVFSALSMGVAERSRALAMLRAIGAFRAQLARLVIAEGMSLSLLGVGIGVPLGLFWVQLLAWWKPDFFSAGVVASWGGVAFGAGGSLLAALAASALPAWNAMRVSPLEAMTPQAQTPSSRLPLWSAAIGLGLVLLDPLVIVLPGLSANWVFRLHFAIGLPALMVGFFLLSPLFVRLVELAGSFVVSRLLGVEPALLRQQLSGGLWRSAGTATALMVGLAVLVVLQVQGHSLLASWQLPDRFPDIFLFSPGGLTWQQAGEIGKIQGIKNDELTPIAITSAEMIDEKAVRVEPFMPKSVMFFGVEPDKALDMMELEFRDAEGKKPGRAEARRLADDAKRRLKLGHGLIVTDDFRQLYGLRVGSPVKLKTPDGRTVDYSVAGVVWSPGIDVIVSVFDMGRQFEERTAASVFGSLEDAREDFAIERVRLFAANLEPGIDKDLLLSRIEAGLKENAATTMTATTSPAHSRRPAGSPSSFGLGSVKDLALQGFRNAIASMGLKAGDVRKIKADIVLGAERVLLMLSTVAFAALGVAALGVTNTVMASIRSRRWQFGVLRSVGVTRGQLLRLVLAEAILLGVVGCALGLAAGFEMSLNAAGLSRVLTGIVVPATIPWAIISIGTAVVMATALLASLGPAWRVSRTEPLALLQAGRAAA